MSPAVGWRDEQPHQQLHRCPAWEAAGDSWRADAYRRWALGAGARAGTPGLARSLMRLIRDLGAHGLGLAGSAVRGGRRPWSHGRFHRDGRTASFSIFSTFFCERAGALAPPTTESLSQIEAATSARSRRGFNLLEPGHVCPARIRGDSMHLPKLRSSSTQRQLA